MTAAKNPQHRRNKPPGGTGPARSPSSPDGSGARSGHTTEPARQPGLALLQCDIHVEGEPWPYAPRLILKAMLEKARDRGLVYNVGCGAEYFLVRRTPDGASSDGAAQPLASAELPGEPPVM